MVTATVFISILFVAFIIDVGIIFAYTLVVVLFNFNPRSFISRLMAKASITINITIYNKI